MVSSTRRRGKQRNGFDEHIEIRHLHDAASAQKRAKHLGIAGQRARVRTDHRLAGGRPPGLIEQQRFSLRVRFACQGGELLRILQSLDDDRDNVDISVINKIRDEIFNRSAQLIAARYEIGEAEFAVAPSAA